MKILIDGTETTLSGSFGNLEEVLQEILKNQISEEKIVWTVRLNGENYSEKSPHDARKIRIDDIYTLEIGTTDKTGIGRSFLENSGMIFDNLCKSAEKISGLFRMSDEKEANRHFVKFLESYRDLILMFRQGEDILELDSQEKLASLEKIADEIIAAQEKEDWIMLADLLEYELAPLLKGALSL
ncbi:MAG: hypothetical protein SRB1_00660 [Desulfobacteraceae bacterium Eth-SRB1]|nr:MAG: hypothetical protein SRB1_00660 [Desulfobacteraceae bacterium Eth-SRB1]